MSIELRAPPPPKEDRIAQVSDTETIRQLILTRAKFDQLSERLRRIYKGRRTSHTHIEEQIHIIGLVLQAIIDLYRTHTSVILPEPSGKRDSNALDYRNFSANGNGDVILPMLRRQEAFIDDILRILRDGAPSGLKRLQSDVPNIVHHLQAFLFEVNMVLVWLNSQTVATLQEQADNIVKYSGTVAELACSSAVSSEEHKLVPYASSRYLQTRLVAIAELRATEEDWFTGGQAGLEPSSIADELFLGNESRLVNVPSDRPELQQTLDELTRVQRVFSESAKYGQRANGTGIDVLRGHASAHVDECPCTCHNPRIYKGPRWLRRWGIDINLPPLRSCSFKFCMDRLTGARVRVARTPATRYNALQHTWRLDVGFSLSRTLEVSRLVTSDSAVFLYCTAGDVWGVKQLLSIGAASIYDVDEDGNTPLHVAARAGRVVLCWVLHDMGASPYEQNLDEDTPTSIAWRRTIRGDLDSARIATDFDPDKQFLHDTNFTPAHQFACGLIRAQDLEVRQLIGINDEDIHRWTPLHWATHMGNIYAIEALLGLNADPHRDPGVLTSACSSRFEDTEGVDLILRHGVDPNKADLEGFTPLQIASMRRNGSNVVRRLLEAGANVSDRFYGEFHDGLQGMTPLHFAASRAMREVCQMLLEAGADPDAQDDQGRTALMALVGGHAHNPVRSVDDIVQLLITYKTEVEHRDHSGMTAANLAVLSEDIDVLRALMAANVPIVHPPDRGPELNGCSRLAWPIEKRKHCVLDFLLKRQDIDPTDVIPGTRETLLHLLAKYGDHESIVIVENSMDVSRLDPDAVDSDQHSPDAYLRSRQVGVSSAMRSLLARVRKSKRIELRASSQRNTVAMSILQTTDRETLSVGPRFSMTENYDSDSSYASSSRTNQEDESDSGYASDESQILGRYHLATAGAPSVMDNLQDAKPTEGRAHVLPEQALNPGVRKNLELSDRLARLSRFSQLRENDINATSWLSFWYRSLLAPILERTLLLVRLLHGVPIVQLLSLIVRPPVKPGHSRVTWKCHCGTELYADFSNQDRMAVAMLSEKLNNPPGTITTPDITRIVSTGGSTSQAGNNGNPRQPAHPGGQLQSNSQPFSGNGRPSSLQPASPGGAQLTTHPPTPAASPKFLELCVNTGKLCQTLGETDVSAVWTDVQLFRTLRERYRKIRGWRIKRQFFLRPSDMDFVNFAFENKRRVHIYAKESFPPETAVGHGSYHYDPCPMQPCPPMPSTAFIHWLHHCNLDKEPMQRIWLDRLPKKLNEPVESSRDPMPIAWGMHVKEGADRAAIFWAMILMILVCIAPLVAYLVCTRDVQSATGIASTILACVALLWMAMQVDIAKNS
ncbi:ankyrin repeat [Vermiconidia calcicola]|uniref:Ankyrin repeat n=1 Tax=Vermiconidia calcicola TaxID=1690605 RepID=A0ACC3MVN0_9PEZI|nr:ankyrin repeat [Vermiconidia calcicola]